MAPLRVPPNDNPFAGEAGVLEEFWAIGLRNPFRMSIDSKTGDIWTGDVGLTGFEEVNVVRKGGNYQSRSKWCST